MLKYLFSKRKFNLVDPKYVDLTEKLPIVFKILNFIKLFIPPGFIPVLYHLVLKAEFSFYFST